MGLPLHRGKYGKPTKSRTSNCFVMLPCVPGEKRCATVAALFLEKPRNQKQWRSPQFATYRSQPTRFALTFVVFYF